jgi:prolyl 4-hydroxylase
VVFPNFVDPARCDHIVEMAKKRMYPSGLAYRPGEAADPEQETRTSSGTFLSRWALLTC